MRELDSIGLRFKPYNREQDHQKSIDTGQQSPCRSPMATKLPTIEENNHLKSTTSEGVALVTGEVGGKGAVTRERDGGGEEDDKEVDREREEVTPVSDSGKEDGERESVAQTSGKEREGEVSEAKEDGRETATDQAQLSAGEREGQEREEGEGDTEKGTETAPVQCYSPPTKDGLEVGVMEQNSKERTGEIGSEEVVNGGERES